MKYIILLFILGCCTIDVQATNKFQIPVVSVIDGDTFRTMLMLPPPLNKVDIRLSGIDAPEIDWMSKCAAETQLGDEAKAYLKSLIYKTTSPVYISDFKWDKYGRRIDATVWVSGQNVNQLMLDKGYAVPYTGNGPRHDWCK